MLPSVVVGDGRWLRAPLFLAAVLAADVGIAMSDMELHHALPRLTVPAVVMAGEHDKLTPPKHAHRIAGELPQLERLVVLPGCGHMGPLERPREVSDALAGLAALVVGRAGPVAA